ncbi:hypothetical protein IV203_006387 [Nitzschia inconspicua]|uniref:Uncharacterized protein n=1 Tax=Nitzschia inconspicua TaxID=303405 RepID=A0A9K3P7P7_9STRA|nr:hypothetical protein IV203_006588 [Nitzschia inconspicua]KAG7339984.1 hypothetical protein IV203_006387 [Nitzschia inconspicua]
MDTLGEGGEDDNIIIFKEEEEEEEEVDDDDDDDDDDTVVAAYADMDSEDLELRILTLTCVAAANCLSYLHSLNNGSVTTNGRRLGCPTIKRTRRSMHELFQELEPDTFRRMFRMKEDSFFLVLEKLDGKLNEALNKKKRTSGAPPNGEISNMARLSMALRWFAGGEKFDISKLHGVHVNEVYKSVWCVVDAVNSHGYFDITFPADDKNQSQMAAEFATKSTFDFENVVAAI